MTIEENARRLAAAHLRKPTDAPLALYAGEAAYLAGAEEVAVAIWSIGDDNDPQMLRLEHDMRAPSEARRISAIANAAFRKHFTDLHIKCVEEFCRIHSCDARRVRDAVWPLTHAGAVEFRTPLHRPTVFYAPELPAAPVEPNSRFPWVGALERAWTAIRREYENAVAGEIAMAPYVPAATREEKWSKLRGAQDWSAIHLFKDAARTPLADLFPETISALMSVDLVKINNVPLEAFFSRLKPGAHIPPHHGLTNTRMTVHLPIIVPDRCAIRVGQVEHKWREGEIVAFDDSFEHEAWNRSGSDRVVLIFETHHPDLTGAERNAVEHTYGVRQNWLNARSRRIAEFARR